MRLILAFAGSLALALPAFATAGFSCSAADKNVAALEVEGLADSEGNLVKFDGALEIAPGEKTAFVRADVKAFVWQKILAIRAAKNTPRGLLEFHIDAKPKPDDETEFEGVYAVRIAKRTITGKIQCSGS